MYANHRTLCRYISASS